MVNKTKSENRNGISLKAKARILSIKDGMFASAERAFGQNYVSPFAVAVNASNSVVALLGSVLGLLGPLSQTLSSRLIEKYSRKKIVVKAVLAESLTWFLFIAVAILYYNNILVDMLPLMVLLFFGFYVIFLNIGMPAWFSWMGDLVSEKQRGRWFAKRNLLVGFVSIILAVSAAFLLDYFRNLGLVMFGFVILFFMAFFFRLLCVRVLKQQYEPKIKLKKGDYFSFWDFLVKARKTNFGKFSIYRMLLDFSVAISSPLIVVYLLRYLEFSYKNYMIIILSATFFTTFIILLWGKFADKYGNYRVLVITSLLIPLIPVLWILNPKPLYLIFVPSLVSGISWAGFHLASGNFIYDNVSQEKRGLVVSYFNLLRGIGTFLGAGLAALLIKYLSTDFIEPLFFIFILSAFARLIVTLLWLPKIKEIKKKEKFQGYKTFKNTLFKDLKPTLLEEAHEIMSIKKYLRS